MKTVFMDTVGLLALWDSSDQWHDRAVRALDALSPRTIMVTTRYVLLECGNAAARRPYRHLVDQARKMMEAGQKLIDPSQDQWQQAWSASLRGEAAEAGIVDHVSFVVMRHLQITNAFTNDRHFTAAGFNVLF